MTINDHITEIRRETMSDVSPERAVLLLQKLSALLGSVNQEWVEAEMNYNRYFEEMTNKFEKISEARAKAKASKEFESKLRAEGLQEVTRELINSLKYVIKIKVEELKESRYQ
jgi:hypothetical protein